MSVPSNFMTWAKEKKNKGIIVAYHYDSKQPQNTSQLKLFRLKTSVSQFTSCAWFLWPRSDQADIWKAWLLICSFFKPFWSSAPVFSLFSWNPREELQNVGIIVSRCSEGHVNMETQDDGSGLQDWIKYLRSKF